MTIPVKLKVVGSWRVETVKVWLSGAEFKMVKAPDPLENQPPPYDYTLYTIGIGIGRTLAAAIIYMPGPARTATGWRQRGSLCWAEMVEGGRWCEADLEVLVDNAWRTHDGRRCGEGCYDARRGDDLYDGSSPDGDGGEGER